MSIQQYLAAAYHPDCDYVDGLLVECNVGQKDHSKLQGEVFAWFRSRRPGAGGIRGAAHSGGAERVRALPATR